MDSETGQYSQGGRMPGAIPYGILKSIGGEKTGGVDAVRASGILAKLLGREIATPDEARALLSLKK